jgi:hypothetical protein
VSIDQKLIEVCELENFPLLIEFLGLSASRFSKITGWDYRSVSKWTKGDPIPKAVNRYIFDNIFVVIGFNDDHEFFIKKKPTDRLSKQGNHVMDISKKMKESEIRVKKKGEQFFWNVPLTAVTNSPLGDGKGYTSEHFYTIFDGYVSTKDGVEYSRKIKSYLT